MTRGTSASFSIPSNGPAITRGHLNDVTAGLGQQMFFWGRDVLTGGNLLMSYGMVKNRSEGLQGTSCYCMPWREGLIELHGACAGWYPAQSQSDGFLFIRNDRRSYVHREPKPVIPGQYDYSRLDSSKLAPLIEASRIFIEWMVRYESWVQREIGLEYRQCCHEMFGRLSSGRTWLAPAEALQWLGRFAQKEGGVVRAKKWLAYRGRP